MGGWLDGSQRHWSFNTNFFQVQIKTKLAFQVIVMNAEKRVADESPILTEIYKNIYSHCKHDVNGDGDNWQFKLNRFQFADCRSARGSHKHPEINPSATLRTLQLYGN